MPQLETPSLLKRINLMHWAGLALIPVLISILLHGTGLYVADKVRWSMGNSGLEEELPDAAKVEIRDGKADNQLEFQGEDSLDSFRADDMMAYPMPDIDYQPIAPDVEYFPDAQVQEKLDIISIQAATVDQEWSNPTTGRQPLNTGYEKLVGSFSRHIKVLREGGLDVVFVFDATHSMGSFILEVKHKIENLGLSIKKIVPTSRIGLVAYQDDDADSRFVTRMQPLSYGTLSLQDFLVDIEAWGGSDYEEAVDVGLENAINDMPWQEKSKKFILLIGDAPPHAEDMDDLIELIERFRAEQGGKIAVIDTRPTARTNRFSDELYMPESSRDFSSEEHSYSTDRHDVLDEFLTIAQAGGGEAARLQNDQKVIQDMLLLIFGSQWENYLGEFMRPL
ncbi:MAG: VWA domain-containing protein [Pseudomonadales bacterium]|nr:VWA domain-containing protein [Pseudomonadales bacterium]